MDWRGRLWTAILALALGLATLTALADSMAPERFAGLDQDRDGRVSRQEYLAGRADKERAAREFSSYDRDGDGRLGRLEFEGRPAPREGAWWRQ